MPIEAGAHPGLDGRFEVLRVRNPVLRDTVYVEGLLGELLLDKDSDVVEYLEIFQFLATSVALDPDESRRLMERLRTGWSLS